MIGVDLFCRPGNHGAGAARTLPQPGKSHFRRRAQSAAQAVGLCDWNSPLDLFKTDEVSLARAVEIAGLDRWQFQDVLHERGIPIVIEAQSAARDGRGDCFLFRFLEMIVADTNLVSTFARIGRKYFDDSLIGARV